eukprot:3135035-Rhodomonas_salina.1
MITTPCRSPNGAAAQACLFPTENMLTRKMIFEWWIVSHATKKNISTNDVARDNVVLNRFSSELLETLGLFPDKLAKQSYLARCIFTMKESYILNNRNYHILDKDAGALARTAADERFDTTYSNAPSVPIELTRPQFQDDQQPSLKTRRTRGRAAPAGCSRKSMQTDDGAAYHARPSKRGCSSELLSSETNLNQLPSTTGRAATSTASEFS